MRQELVPLERPEDWTAGLREVPHGFWHTWEACHAIKLTSGRRTYLYRFDCDGCVVVCPVSERVFDGFTDLVTPYGLAGFTGSGECPLLPEAWRRFACARGYVCAYVGLNPLFSRDSYRRAQDVCEYNDVYVLDLTLDEEELFTNLSGNRKRQIRARQRIDASVIWERETLIEFFVDHYQEFMSRRGAAPVYALARDTLLALGRCERVLLLGAEGRGGVEAVCLFGYTRYAADFLFGVSLPNGRDHSTWLVWQGVMRLRAMGVPIVNLGGGIQRGDGVAEFKRRFGARRLPLTALKQVFDATVYTRLCAATRSNPADRTGYFPAYHAPRSA